MANLGLQSYQAGVLRELLHAQVQRGFAFVEEKCMQELLKSRGKAIPEGDEEDLSWKTELTLACLAAIKPDMTDTEASACIARAFVERRLDSWRRPPAESASNELRSVGAGVSIRVGERLVRELDLGDQLGRVDVEVNVRVAPSDAPDHPVRPGRNLDELRIAVAARLGVQQRVATQLRVGWLVAE